MSRSRRQTPIRGITSADTEKQDKRDANRRIRRTIRQALSVEPDAEIFPHERELSNPWLMGKDGKQWFDPGQSPGHLRK